MAKKRKVTLLVAKLDRLSRSVAFIATLMDSRGFDLAIADMQEANQLTLHVLAAAAEHERHVIGARTRQAAAKARGTRLGNPEQARINRAKAAVRAHALRAATPLDGFNTGFFICGVIMLVGGTIAMALVNPEREAKRRLQPLTAST